jgi:hypothetical protein
MLIEFLFNEPFTPSGPIFGSLSIYCGRSIEHDGLVKAHLEAGSKSGVDEPKGSARPARDLHMSTFRRVLCIFAWLFASKRRAEHAKSAVDELSKSRETAKRGLVFIDSLRAGTPNGTVNK